MGRRLRFATLAVALAALAGCASTPEGGPGEGVPAGAVLGGAIELMGEPAFAVRAGPGPPGIVHVAVVAERGDLVLLAVGRDGTVGRNALAQIDAEEVYDLAVGSDGSVHVLLARDYLRASATGRSVAPAGRCERLALAGARALCLGPLDPAFPDSGERGRWDPVGTVGPQQGRKRALYSFEADRWVLRAVLERDSAWDVGRAELVVDRGGQVHVVYVADGPLDAFLQKTLVRVATFELPDGAAAARQTRVVDIWELPEESGLDAPAEVDTASGRAPTLANRRRFGFTEPAAEAPRLAVAWPNSVERTLVGSGPRPAVQVGTEGAQVVLLEDGRFAGKLPLPPGRGGWTTFVLAALLAPAGDGRVHAVTVAKGDLLGFANRVRYQHIEDGRWSRSLDLGLAGDRPDLVRIAPAERGDALVVLPTRSGALVARWILREPPARGRAE